jgi:hypothetical protein
MVVCAGKVVVDRAVHNMGGAVVVELLRCAKSVKYV